LTVEQQAAKKAKAEATRAKRGTTSKKAKLAIKGDVTGVVVTPVTRSMTAAPAQQQQATSASPATPVNGTSAAK
jgi:hypothetical protein